MGIGEIWVGMPAAEIFLGDAVAHRSSRCPEKRLEDHPGVRPGDRVHGIEGQVEVAA